MNLKSRYKYPYEGHKVKSPHSNQNVRTYNCVDVKCIKTSGIWVELEKKSRNTKFSIQRSSV